jgi:uncharacterized protein DUF732
VRARKVVMAGIALVALGGCSSDGDGGGGDVPNIAPTVQAPDPAEASAAAAKRAEAANDVDSYVAALKAIDPKLVKDQVDATDKGKSICLDLEQGKTEAQAAKSAAQRFAIDEQAALKVVTATKAALCPGKR